MDRRSTVRSAHQGSDLAIIALTRRWQVPHWSLREPLHRAREIWRRAAPYGRPGANWPHRSYERVYRGRKASRSRACRATLIYLGYSADTRSNLESARPLRVRLHDHRLDWRHRARRTLGDAVPFGRNTDNRPTAEGYEHANTPPY